MQSDLWVVGSRLDDRKIMISDKVATLEAERDMIAVAIEKIRKRIQELSAG